MKLPRSQQSHLRQTARKATKTGTMKMCSSDDGNTICGTSELSKDTKSLVAISGTCCSMNIHSYQDGCIDDMEEGQGKQQDTKCDQQNSVKRRSITSPIETFCTTIWESCLGLAWSHRTDTESRLAGFIDYCWLHFLYIFRIVVLTDENRYNKWRLIQTSHPILVDSLWFLFCLWLAVRVSSGTSFVVRFFLTDQHSVIREKGERSYVRQEGFVPSVWSPYMRYHDRNTYAVFTFSFLITDAVYGLWAALPGILDYGA